MKVLELLGEEGTLSVGELAERLRVTGVTVRRDLAALEREGYLVRTYGGCTVSPPMLRHLSHHQQDSVHVKQKAAIARVAVGLLALGQSVYVDWGTTCYHFARSIPSELNLTVFTNNLRVVTALSSRTECRVVVYGGELLRETPYLGGEIAMARMQDFLLDVAVFGATAIDAARGQLHADSVHAPVVYKLLESNSTQQFILADSSKLTRRGSAILTTLRAGVTLITDAGIGERDLALLQQTGARVIVAKIQKSS